MQSNDKSLEYEATQDISQIKKSRISSFRNFIRPSTINIIDEKKDAPITPNLTGERKISNESDFFTYNDTSPKLNYSRFYSDFEDIVYVNKGGFGEVFKAVNKVDKNVYAIKKMILNYDEEDEVRKLILEAQTLSKLNHENIVRYYQAWTENIPVFNFRRVLLTPVEDYPYDQPMLRTIAQI